MFFHAVEENRKVGPISCGEEVRMVNSVAPCHSATGTSRVEGTQAGLKEQVDLEQVPKVLSSLELNWEEQWLYSVKETNKTNNPANLETLFRNGSEDRA